MAQTDDEQSQQHAPRRDDAAPPTSAGDELPPTAIVFFDLARLVNLMARPFAEQVGRPLALSLPEWRTLVAVVRRPGASGSEIAAMSGLDKMTVSRALASLARQGRVERGHDESDRRRNCVVPTPAGRELLNRVIDIGRARADRVFGALDDAELAALSATLEKLIARFDDAAPSDE